MLKESNGPDTRTSRRESYEKCGDERKTATWKAPTAVYRVIPEIRVVNESKRLKDSYRPRMLEKFSLRF